MDSQFYPAIISCVNSACITNSKLLSGEARLSATADSSRSLMQLKNMHHLRKELCQFHREERHGINRGIRLSILRLSNRYNHPNAVD